MAVPVVVVEQRRARLLRRLGARRASRVVALVYCQEAVALFGFPVIRYATLSDPREVLAAIAAVPRETPLDLVVQLPCSLELPIDEIAAALAAHGGQATLFVPLYALSGGLELAQAADMVVLGPRAAMAAAAEGSPALAAHDLRALGATVHVETPAELAAYMRLCPQPPQPPARWFVDVPRKPGETGYMPGDRREQYETLPILGMTCATCAARVQKALRGVPGVVRAEVNLATEKATVDYLAGLATHAALAAAVRAAGYDVAEPPASTAGGAAGARPAAHAGATDAGPTGAKPWPTPRPRPPPRRRRAAAVYRQLKIKVVVGAVFAWSSSWAACSQLVPVPALLAAQRLRAVGAGDAGPVLGRRAVLPRRLGALRHGTTDMNTLIAMGSSAAYFYSVLGVALPGLLRASRPRHADVLRLGRAHHHAHPLRPPAGGARQGPDRPPSRRSSACSPRRRACCATAPRPTCRSPQVVPATSCVVRPGEKVPVDGVVIDGALGRRRVDAHRRADAGGQGAGRRGDRRHHEHAPARSPSAPPRWAPRRRWRRSSGWCERGAGLQAARSRAWPTSSPATSCRR